MKQLLIKEDPKSHKIGINEVVGLKQAITEVMKPIQQALKDKVYWNDCKLEELEYKSRDGFIPYSHNCGGLELAVIVPKCEEYDFGFLTFGEWDGEHYCDGTDKDNCECMYDQDGEYDAYLRIILKFEGIEDGKLKFYLSMHGGNGDAPYFRTKYSEDYFEADFECSSIEGLKRASSKHVKALIKILTGGVK